MGALFCGFWLSVERNRDLHVREDMLRVSEMALVRVVMKKLATGAGMGAGRSGWSCLRDLAAAALDD